jgi:HK97 family phage major capsid protein
MTKLEQYQKQHTETLAAMRKLNETAAAANELGEFTAEQDAEYKTLDKKRLTLEASIERERSVETSELRATAVDAAPAAPGGSLMIVRGGHERASDRPWASFGEQLQAIVAAYSPSMTVDPRLFAAASGMQQSVPSEGGFAIAPQFVTEIWDKLNQGTGNLLGMTDQYTVIGESLSFPANAETSRVTGSRYGGVQGYWINEADQIMKSKPKLRKLTLEPQELAVLIYGTAKALDNAAGLQQYLTRAAVDEIGFLVGDAIVNGNGVGKPKGITASGCKIAVAKETNQAAATVVQENIVKMWARLHPRSRPTAVWLHNVDVEPQFDLLNTVVKNVAGTENVGGYANKVFDSEARTLKGRPIIAVEYCQTLGTEGDLILVDLGAYASGVRAAGLKFESSIHVRFEFAETAFRFMFAADGQTWLASALTPFKGSNTLSTVVTLATRA